MRRHESTGGGRGTDWLFVCVANSARSQMAEGFARRMAPDGVGVWSAGSDPASLHPSAVEVMREVGIDLSSHRSKSVQEIDRERVGTVVTLCAEEVCPLFPGEVRRHHWPLEDPAAATGTDEERLAAFRRVRDEIRMRLQELLAD